jgi:DNA modification methylase
MGTPGGTGVITILQGDWIEQLKTMPDESVHCCVTSPPYWGLRDYGVAGQLGLEKTPELYVSKMVEGFREVRRVLREDGTCWVNLGDSYCAHAGQRKSTDARGPKQCTNRGSCDTGSRDVPGLKAKDLVGIPWRVAFALQADGWFLRSDIIWHKPNPMPESVTDRPTKAHEYIFLLTKSQRYYYDAMGIAEPLTRPEEADRKTPARFGGAYKWTEAQKQSRLHSGNEYNGTPTGTRNRRTVWTVPSSPYPEAHFATYPPDLIKPCILAGTSARGCCPKCGAPWERIIVKGAPDLAHQRACGGDINGEYHGQNKKNYQAHKAQPASTVKARILAGMVERKTVDWKPSCNCYAIEDTPEPIPCTVLDPFGGSGTTGQVALELGRKAILIELNPEYVDLIQHRTNVTPGLALA